MSAPAVRGRGSEPLSGAQKCAVLCMSLGPAGAARILQQLDPDELERVTREITTMPAVPREVVQQVLQEYQNASAGPAPAARGGTAFARAALEQAVGPSRAGTVMERVQEQVVDTGLKRLKRAAPEVLAGILRGEHPQTIALILAHLDVRQAAGLVQAMDGPLAGEVLYRVARMEKISPDVLHLVETGLSSKTDLTLSQEMTLSGGPAAVARLLNLTGGPKEKEMLESIGGRNTELAGQIKSLMFVFEDLLLVDNKGMQRVLREVETKELALALKAASPELRQHIKSAMSERAAGALEEEIEILGPVRVRDVEAAHTRIIEAVRALEDSGDIMIRSRGGTDDIIG
jgi:flagellar motor switch protein FliG